MRQKVNKAALLCSVREETESMFRIVGVKVHAIFEMVERVDARPEEIQDRVDTLVERVREAGDAIRSLLDTVGDSHEQSLPGERK